MADINLTPPESAKKNAQKALDWRKKHPKETADSGTSVGWTRAGQLAKGGPVSEDVVKRMAQFSRHRKNATVNPKYKDEPWKDNGYLMWLAWGGTTGVDWAMRKAEELKKKVKNNMKTNMLKQIDGRWYVYDSTGTKNVGKKEGFESKAEADKQLKAIEASKTKRQVNVYTQVNQSQIHRKSGTIVIKDVVPIVDDIAMNGILYPAMEINQSYESIEDTPAPIGHPMNDQGNYISAKSGKALINYFAGAINTNVRKEGERVLMDVEINERQAYAHPDGIKLMEAIEAKEPIHVSTGLFLNTDDKDGVDVNGTSYNRVGRDFEFDHVAILLDEPGAATPEHGVGMFVNAEGNKQPVEFAHLVINVDNIQDEPEPGFFAKLKQWLSTNSNLLANEVDLSMDMKEKIAALKKNGLYKEGMKDEEVTNAYNEMMKGEKKKEKATNAEISALVTNAVNEAVKPLNEKIASLESELHANSDKELNEIADLVANSEKGKALGLDKDSVKAMGLDKAKEIAANCGYASGLKPQEPQANSYDKFEMELPE